MYVRDHWEVVMSQPFFFFTFFVSDWQTNPHFHSPSSPSSIPMGQNFTSEIYQQNA